MEFAGKDKKETTYKERLDLQLSRLDNRKKEVFAEVKGRAKSDEEQ